MFYQSLFYLYIYFFLLLTDASSLFPVVLLLSWAKPISVYLYCTHREINLILMTLLQTIKQKNKYIFQNVHWSNSLIHLNSECEKTQINECKICVIISLLELIWHYLDTNVAGNVNKIFKTNALLAHRDEQFFGTGWRLSFNSASVSGSLTGILSEQIFWCHKST